jgi:hypothetical protein
MNGNAKSSCTSASVQSLRTVTSIPFGQVGRSRASIRCEAFLVNREGAFRLTSTLRTAHQLKSTGFGWIGRSSARDGDDLQGPITPRGRGLLAVRGIIGSAAGFGRRVFFAFHRQRSQLLSGQLPDGRTVDQLGYRSLCAAATATARQGADCEQQEKPSLAHRARRRQIDRPAERPGRPPSRNSYC